MVAGKKVETKASKDGHSYFIHIPGSVNDIDSDVFTELVTAGSLRANEKFSAWEFSRQLFIETAWFLKGKGFVLDGIHPEDLEDDDMPWLEDC